MDSGGWGWSLMTVVAPLILAVVLAWAVFRNRRSRVSKDVSERGAERVYREEEQKRRAGRDDEEA